jgi:two-component system cell cycle sensor histidine kinase/response regulator CckA
MAIDSVKVPPAFEPLFAQAQEYVQRYFQNREDAPDQGTITIGGERYILVRAASMSVHFLDFVKNMYPGLDEREAVEASTRVLFDIAHAIGNADAGAFHKATGMVEPVAKLSTGPVHFAYTGWGFVDISSESNPTPDEEYYLLYDHPQSFEADSWIAQRGTTDFCTCVMSAGYSSGWCQESFDIHLTAQEILCRARGDAVCRFIMAPPDHIRGHIDRYVAAHPEHFPPASVG